MGRADIEVPNRSVDVSSRDRSACYPRSSFYPLIDGPSTRNRRVTRPCFRTCSTCRSRSQAPLCPCTLRAIADRAEGTFGRLRYPLGGDRPSQTAHLTLSPGTIQCPRLVPQPDQGGISPAPPPPPERGLLRLPPILRRPDQDTMPGCSKASRGLSVLPRVQGIFTLTTISPGPSARQCGSRWTIHAGRNLPDKEFRYLRTVIVTAAVYRGFGSGLAPLPLTFRHWAGCSPHTSSYEFAETCVFGKQSPPPILCGPRELRRRAPTPPRAPLLPQLRGQFAEFLTEGSPERLGALTPAHLCRFAVRSLRLHRLGVLSWQCGVARFAP